MKRASAFLNQTIRPILFLLLLPILFSACNIKITDMSANTLQYASFKDIPGVTKDEIEAIEALQKQTDFFVYGMERSTETFLLENGEIGGFTALFCDWLSGLFEIPFKPAIREWGNLLSGLETRDVDFTGELTATDERRKTYFMTSTIVQRTIKTFRIEDSEPLAEIAERRPLRCAFPLGSTLIADVTAMLQGEYEIVEIYDNDSTYVMLKNGEVDVFFTENPAEAAFDVYGDVEVSDFLPLIFSPVSLTTQNPSLEPVISVVQKALDNGALIYLVKLYNTGYQEYLRYKLHSQLSEEEIAYIRDHPVVPFAAGNGNYPVSFYNAHEKKWQGISFDMLSEVENLTGLRFELAHDQNTIWRIAMSMLENGEVSMISGIIRSNARQDSFLWADTPIMTDYYALISKSDYRDISLNEILHIKIGIISRTSYAEEFSRWFPDHKNVVAYRDTTSAIDALERGEIDMLMANEGHLILIANYRELTGYKANIIFNNTFDSSFGFNKDEVVLCSIVDKALRLINTGRIADRWKNRTFDYRIKVMQAQMPWIIASSALFLSALTIVSVLFVKNRRARIQLELQTTMFNTLFDSIPDLVFAKDANSRFLQCNKSFLEHFACRKEDTIGKNDFEAFGIPVDIMDKYQEVDRRVMKECRILTQEEIIPRFDGTSPFYETIKSPIVLKGAVIGLLAISRDMTAHKQAQEAALAAARAKGTFLAHMSHEIRTPLNAIIGMSFIAKDCIDDKVKALRSVNQIMTSSQHLLGILNDILDMSKIESGKLELTHEPFSLLTACSEVSDIMTHRCEEKNITFITNIHEIKDITITGDKLRLNQVLINLLGNAVKFTDTNGEIKFITELLEENDERAQIKFSVSDNGIGMNEEQMKRLFIPFEQADNTIAARFGGTGLGLSLSQNFVNMMGGKISVTSELDKGSTFDFSLWFNKSELSSSQDLDDKEKYENVDLSGKRILLVEDIEINRLIVRELLSSGNPAIDEAENGRQAVETFSGSPEGYYDIILMDIQMPVLDGYEAAKEIRALNRADAETVPIIAMTAHAYKEDVEQALEVGMNGHLAKPIDKPSLMQTVGKILKG